MVFCVTRVIYNNIYCLWRGKRKRRSGFLEEVLCACVLCAGPQTLIQTAAETALAAFSLLLSKQSNLLESDNRGACLDFAALLPLLQTRGKLLCSAYLFFRLKQMFFENSVPTLETTVDILGRWKTREGITDLRKKEGLGENQRISIFGGYCAAAQAQLLCL